MQQVKNTVWWGLGIGFTAPLVSGSLALWLMQKVTALKGADLLLIGCVAINALLMNSFFKQHKDNVGRGILAATFFWAFVFFGYKVWQETHP